MANDMTSFMHWYRRYKVRAQDMTDFQEALAETARAPQEGLVGAAVLKGFGVSPASGLVLNAASGIAVAASGYLQIVNSETLIDAAVATGASPVRSLIVVSPLLTDSDYINSPTIPFTQVPLHQLQQAEVRIIPGTPSDTPEYPAKGANDTILCGLILQPGVGTILSSMLDFEVRETIGANSLIAQNQVKFDDRLRAYRSDYKTLGIKPAQTVGSKPMGFINTGKGSPSVYPLMAGTYVEQDSFVDFETGVISGGDTTSPALVPNIPPANNSVICAVDLTRDDVLLFTYGVVGSYAQCKSAVQQQTFFGPGSLPEPSGNFTLAYVIVSSRGGVISDIQVLDARPLMGMGVGAAKYFQEAPTGAVNGSNSTFELTKLPADPDSLILFIDGLPLEAGKFTINEQTIEIIDVGSIPAPGQSLYAYYLIYGAVSVTGGSGTSGAEWAKEIPSGAVNGINDTFILSSPPVDDNSLFFWIDNQPLDLGDYTLSGQIVTITNPDVIPAPGQRVLAQFIFAGSSPGGGGGGDGRYTVYGSSSGAAPISAASGLSVSSAARQLRYVKSNGGAVTITANPRIASGAFDGQELALVGTSNTDYPIFNDGNGLDLNGSISLVQGARIQFTWDAAGIVWSEQSRR